MKKILLFFSFILIPALTFSQYDQKISATLSVGGFKTFGPTGTDSRPMQMPNYKPGFAVNAGMQLKLSNRFSLAAEGGVMISSGWKYKGYDFVNDLTWTIDDTVSGNTLTGQNYLDIYNYSLGVRVKYYFRPDKKWNPYFFTGVSANITRCYFDNTEWQAYSDLGWLGAEDTIPPNDNLERSAGLGFNPGFGVEYSPKDQIHLFLESDYNLILLQKDKFKDIERQENFHAIRLRAGVRINFIKSKEL